MGRKKKRHGRRDGQDETSISWDDDVIQGVCLRDVACEPTVRYRCSGGLVRLLWLHKGENEQPLIVNNKLMHGEILHEKLLPPLIGVLMGVLSTCSCRIYIANTS